MAEATKDGQLVRLLRNLSRRNAALNELDSVYQALFENKRRISPAQVELRDKMRRAIDALRLS